MTGISLAAAVAVALVTYDEIHNLNRMPCPARYILVLALFASIGLLTAKYPAFGSAVAWALVIGIAVGDNSTIPVVSTASAVVTRRPQDHPKGKTRGGKQT